LLQGTLGALGEAVRAEAEDSLLPLSQEKEIPGYNRKNLTKSETPAEKKAADKQDGLDNKLKAQKKKNALAEAAKIKAKAQEKLQKAEKLDQSVKDDEVRLTNGKVADQACKDKPGVKCSDKKALCDSTKEAEKKDARSNCPATCGACDGLAVPKKIQKADTKSSPGGKWVVAQVQKQARAAVKAAVSQAQAKVKQMIAEGRRSKQNVVKETADKIKSLLSSKLANKPDVLSTVDSAIADIVMQASSPKRKAGGSATVKQAIDMLQKPTGKKPAANADAQPAATATAAANGTVAVKKPAANATAGNATAATSNATTNTTAEEAGGATLSMMGEGIGSGSGRPALNPNAKEELGDEASSQLELGGRTGGGSGGGSGAAPPPLNPNATWARLL